MSVIDWLRKLGILRFGAEAAVYRNEAERPTSFMMDDVYNSEKDLVHRKEKPDQTESSEESEA